MIYRMRSSRRGRGQITIVEERGSIKTGSGEEVSLTEEKYEFAN